MGVGGIFLGAWNDKLKRCLGTKQGSRDLVNIFESDRALIRISGSVKAALENRYNG
jgi:hypothetical protein